MSIGEVLAVLRPEFSDVTISKIRFLEEQGLIEPERSPAGYRKFTHEDVERLRYVLGVQRDHYLPLRVIREHLEAIDHGVEPPALPGAANQALAAGGQRGPRLVGDVGAEGRFGQGTDLRLSRAALIESAGVTAGLIAELESFGLLAPRSTGQFDGEALAVARAAGALAGFGIEPRHLRAFRSAADREAGLVEQVVTPLRRQRDTEASARADEVEREVADLCLRLHTALVRSALDRGGN